ncbi:MAG: hypothetical protein MIO92_08690 [Methanosarcinaceae archaeon]|nr:hypothetical protein [Methanosarcinaceae archaeon]
MDKRALWSKIIGIVALMLMVVGFGLIMGGSRRLGYGSLVFLGIILAAASAFLSGSSSRKLVLWGAGVYAAIWIPAFVLSVISALKAGEKPVEPPILITLTVIAGILSLLTIVVGTIGNLLDDRRPASPPMSNGTGEDLTGATPADPGSLHSVVEIKRIGRKIGLVWGGVAVAMLLFIVSIFLATRGGEKTGEPHKLYAEGQYFTVGSTREEVLRIQGPPTYKLEMVWFYGDSQVQFDSDGKVTNIWDVSKNLKAKSVKLPSAVQ